MTAKGIKKSYIKHHVRHPVFVNVLRDKKHSSPARFHTFKSTNHVINTVEIKKSCLSPIDTKRYILPDGISTWRTDIVDSGTVYKFVTIFCELFV